jgi:hypothetical protein
LKCFRRSWGHPTSFIPVLRRFVGWNRGQQWSVACIPHIRRHEDVLKRVPRPRAPYPVTQFNYLSDLVTTYPLPSLISSADFDSRRHLVSRLCRCDRIPDGKSSQSIGDARGCDGGGKPHEDVTAPVVWGDQAELSCGARQIHCASDHCPPSSLIVKFLDSADVAGRVLRAQS